MNLTVVGLSRDAEKRTKLKALGADFVFDPEDRNLPRSVSAAISPKKVHLAVDCVGVVPRYHHARRWRTDQYRRQECGPGP